MIPFHRFPFFEVVMFLLLNWLLCYFALAAVTDWIKLFKGIEAAEPYILFTRMYGIVLIFVPIAVPGSIYYFISLFYHIRPIFGDRQPPKWAWIVILSLPFLFVVAYWWTATEILHNAGYQRCTEEQAPDLDDADVGSLWCLNIQDLNSQDRSFK